MINRREMLLGAGGVAIVAAGGRRPAAAFSNPPVERAVTVFSNYAEWSLARSTSLSDIRLPPADVDSAVLVISDASPAVFADHGRMALLRPAALEMLPTAVLADLAKRAGPLVLSAHGTEAASRPAEKGDPTLWRRLAELMAMPGTPVNALLDLGGALRGEEAVRAGIETFRQTYAQQSTGAVSIARRDLASLAK